MKIFALCVLYGLLSQSVTAQMPKNKPDEVRVLPKEMNDVLNNPGIGFTTLQRFNGDSLNEGSRWTEGLPIVYQKNNGNLANKDYPQTSIAYFRVNWRFLEPEMQHYNWDMIDKALKTAAERGQTLMLRISPYEAGDEKDVPDWYRKMVGKETPQISEHWRIDHNDPRFVQYFGGMVKALGQRYDGHPDIESVDISFAGYWGEGEGTHLLSDPVRLALINSYLDNFKKTILTFQPLNGDSPDPGALVKGTNIAAYWPDGSNNGTGNQMRNLGYRMDCFGDLRKTDWNHMKDVYPEDIIKSGMSEAWKKAPVAFEICATFLSWLEKYNYSKEMVEYVFDQGLKWHMSSFNAKSSAVPEEWRPMVDKWLNKMGYRFVLRRFTYPATVKVNGQLAITSWWENKGVAPIYRDYKFSVRLKDSKKTVILNTNADIRNWLPGDILHDEKLYIPNDMPPGAYQIEIAIVSPDSFEPKIKLAIEGIDKDGWYPMGEIEVQKNNL